ncbi:hypothetical protein QM588_05145 [Rhodococcus sp. IEGM 1354]|uniref:hypothetical protein n=1 Tax=Rhodococcus sp. IEGM 1354 TaxID=3047088 RepID=UPI0024B6BEA9|nr:hypothetical protein [Rhodococcus sp. IEGM 1354]MDI9929783.1 hypothetical protein [Rhodococcus sp. IEGM 1354]
MTTLQLVRAQHYAVVKNPQADAPATFARGATLPVLLGSQDLVKIAILLRGVSFIPARLSLVDRTFTALDSDTYEEEQGVLLRLIRRADELAITNYLWNELSGFYIAGIDFINENNPIMRISVRQKGVLNASDYQTGENFANILNSARFNE